MTRRLFVGEPTIKDFMPRPGSESWPNKKDIIQRTPRFSKPVVNDGMKTTRKGSSRAREPMFKRTRNMSAIITKDNAVKTTGHGYTSIGKAIMSRIRNGSGEDFVSKDKKIGKNEMCSYTL